MARHSYQQPGTVVYNPQIQSSADGKKKKNGKGWTLLFWLSLLIFLVAAFFIVKILFQYNEGKAEYVEIADNALEITSSGDDDIIPLDSLTVNWDYLLGINSQTVAWIYMPGTTINYPVVWCGDDYTYLQRKFDGGVRTNVDFGCIFVEGKNNPDLTDRHNILFGHAMSNGTMFSALYRMSKNGTFNDTRDIYILTQRGNLHLRTFAYVYVTKNQTEILATTFDTDEEFVAFVRDKIDQTMFEPNTAVPTPEEMGRIFSFVTCADSSGRGRYVVYAYIAESTIEDIPAGRFIDFDAVKSLTAEDVEGLGGQGK